MKLVLNTLAPLLILTAAVPCANASVLIFRANPDGPFTNDSPVPAGYGNNIAGPTQGGFRYETTGEVTPNIVVSYSNDRIYNSDYGDLGSVIYSAGPTLTLVFTADPGFLVRLDSFDMAGFGGSGETIPTISVTNGSTTFTQSGLVAPGTGHNTVTVSGNPSNSSTGEIVTLSISDVSNGLSGFTNFQFSQIPEPSQFALLGLSALGFVAFRRRSA